MGQRRHGGRTGRWLAALLMIAALGSGWGRPDAVTARQDDAEERPLDLAAMALTPADLADVGLDGYTISAAAWRTPEEVVASTASGSGLDEDDVAEVLVDEAELGASYELDLDLTDPESDVYLATVRVRSSFSEHPDAEAAEIAYGYRTDEGNISGAEDIDAADFGDESEVTQIGFQPEEGAAYAGYDLSLRVDRVYAGIQILVFGNDGEEVDEIELPDLDDLEAMADLLAPKIEAGLEGDADGFGLSLQVQRLSRDTAPFLYYDQYDYVDGVYAPYYGEIEVAESIASGFADIDATARYTLRQAAAVGDTPTLEDVLYTAQLYAFEDEDEAAAWVGDALGYLESDTRYSDVETDEVADDLGDLGDASVGASYVFDYGQGPVDGVVVYLAVGDVGAALFVESVPGVGVAALGEIAEAQVDCLEDSACPDPVDAPEKAAAEDDEDAGDESTPVADDEDADGTPVADGDEADSEETPDADADGEVTPNSDDQVTPESDESDQETADEDGAEDGTPVADDEADEDSEEVATGGGVYESPNYGFTLTWDPDEWEVLIEDEDPDDDYDSIFLFNGASLVGVTGDPDYDTDDPDQLQDCVDDYALTLERNDAVSDLEPLDDEGASGNEEGIAWATYSYTYEYEDGTVGDQVRYYGCQVIGDGLVLVVVHDAAADDYDGEIEAREQLLEGFEAEEDQ